MTQIEDIKPHEGHTCKHCALKIERGGKGRDINTWVHVESGFRLCESGDTPATP
jgi:hypothetical protein